MDDGDITATLNDEKIQLYSLTYVNTHLHVHMCCVGTCCLSFGRLFWLNFQEINFNKMQEILFKSGIYCHNIINVCKKKYLSILLLQIMH